MTLGLCMIVKNEQEILDRCLISTSNIFDEIIIVDTGSSDNTVNIAKNYTDKIYHFNWIDDFSKARNYAFDLSTTDYIMWLDADDVLPEDTKEELIKLKNKLDSDINIYMLKYNISFDSMNKPTFSYYRERIIKNNKLNKWTDRVHEYIPLTGNLSYTDIAINHISNKTIKSFRNIDIYEDMKKKKEIFSSRNLYYYARELYEHEKYTESIKTFNELLKQKDVWIEDVIDSCILLSHCYYFIGDIEMQLEYLLKTFSYTIPRKKVCCLIGNWFFNNNKYNEAIFWYETSLIIKDSKNYGFYESDYEYFIPYLNLSVTYFKIGDKINAKKYHELSKKIKPNNELILTNENYFKILE